MALIEGFRVQNYRALREVTLGKLSNQQHAEPLTPFTVVIGKNGAGKSTLFDAFGFVADCLTHDVETACDMKQRGGFEGLRSRGTEDPIAFEIYYREAPKERPMTYELAIALDASGRPFVKNEVLKQRRKGVSHGRPYPFLRLVNGAGHVWAGEEAVEALAGEEDSAQEAVELTDLRQLGIATLGTLKEHPRIKRFRDFLKAWYLSYFYPDAARGLPSAGPQKHLNVHGDNIGNVVQLLRASCAQPFGFTRLSAIHGYEFMEREQKERFRTILDRIAVKIPGIDRIDTKVTDDKRVLLRFNDGAFSDPFFAWQMSDGTLKVFAYLLLLEDPEPPPLHLHRGARERSLPQAPRGPSPGVPRPRDRQEELAAALRHDPSTLLRRCTLGQRGLAPRERPGWVLDRDEGLRHRRRKRDDGRGSAARWALVQRLPGREVADALRDPGGRQLGGATAHRLVATTAGPARRASHLEAPRLPWDRA